MSNLLLDTLEVKDYRAFNHLKIEQLGRVNLFVGKNNIGKSSLLEALWLYAQKALPTVILDLLETRDEYSDRRLRRESNSREIIGSLKSLFYGRPDFSGPLPPITIGPIGEQETTLSIGIEWQERDEAKDQLPLLEELNRNEQIPYLVLKQGYRTFQSYNLIGLFDREYVRATRFRQTRLNKQSIPSYFINTNGLNNDEVARLWDGIALTDLEEDVLSALHLITPEVERLSFIGSSIESSRRFPVIKTSKFSEPIPLRSLGDGMNRLLGVVLALVNSKDGILLIDEIENGLHYTVQPKIWQMVFKVASRLNVQVFATTHSWDCVQAFQWAAVEDHSQEGLLIRLEEIANMITATVFNERKLEIATREHIEVR